MIGSRLRASRVSLVAVLVAASVLAGAVTRPAAASSSATGILNNAWIITELGGSALSQQAQLSPYERGLATTATTATVASTGLAATPKAGGRLGMVLNTVAVLGGLAGFAFGGGDDEPEFPVPPAQTSANGSPSQGWTNFGTLSGVSGGSGGNHLKLTFAPVGATGGYNGIWYRVMRLDTNQFMSGWSIACYNPCTQTGTGFLGHYGYPVRYEWSYASGQPSNTVNVGNLGQTWFPASGQTITNPQPGTSSDPATVPRYVDSYANCKTPGGGVQTITDRVGPFYISPGAPWSTPALPDLTCPAGTFLTEGGRDVATEGLADVPLQEPYVAPAWVEDQVTRFPDCYPATATMCELKVWRIAPVPALDCHTYGVGSANPCSGWWSDPKRSSTYECRFGGTAVAMRRCSPYAETFTNGTVAPSEVDPDAPVSDPVPGLDPTPEATPNLGDCVPNWSLELLNPWWVFKAQACALMWAFVPQTSLQTRVSAIKTDLEYRVPFVWFDGFVTIPGAVPDGGCPDWRVKIPNPGGEGYQLDKNVVCESSYTDALRTARPVLLVFMASLAFWPMIRSIGYASFPVIKPIPGGVR